MNNPLVLISILNWNNAPITIRCIESLKAAGYCSNSSYEICVVDNASNPSDKHLLEEYLSKINIPFHENKVNTGFAGGHNQVIKLAIERGIEFVWLLNNDCIVLPNTIELLLNAMRVDERCGACSPVFAYEDSQDVYFAGAYQNWDSLSSIWCPNPWSEDFHRIHSTDIWLTGTAILLRMTALVEIGLLNEDFFAYCEDDDLGERLRLNKWRNIILKDVITYHGPAPLTEVKRPPYFYYLTARNHTFFYLKYTPDRHRRFIRVRLLAHSVHRSDCLASDQHPALAHAVLAGLQDGLTGALGKPAPSKPLALWFKSLVLLVRGLNKVHQLVLSSATH